MLAQHRRRKAAQEATRERVRCEMAVLMDTGVRVNPMLAAMHGVQNAAVDRVSTSSTSELPVVTETPTAASVLQSRASSPAAPTRSLGPSPSASMHPSPQPSRPTASRPSVPSAPQFPPPPPPRAMPPSLPSAPSSSLVLQQASVGVKRKRSRAEAKRESTQNPWWCTCRSQWPISGGNPHHDSACLRKRFHDASPSQREWPVVGQIVTCMSTAGPRAGKRFRCERVDRSGWVPVED